jgi:hypothetical protein
MAKTTKKVLTLEDSKVKAGRLIKVWNTDRKKFSNEAKQYTAVYVEDANGKNERCWLLTDKEIERLNYRSERNKEDWLKKDFLTDLLD